VFLGERVAPLQLVADGFVKLLQMTVLPYVTVSIVGGLGRLQYAHARALGLRAAVVLGGLWLLALVFMFLIPLTFPSVQTASFFSTTLVERRPPLDFIELYIPSNPFHSLANNIVPAVVLFSVLLGVALIGVERKQVLLDVLGVAGDALSRVTRFVVRLTPYGLRHRGDRCRNAEPRADRPAAGLPDRVCPRRAAGQPVGIARTRRGADAHPGAGHLRAQP
jgi:Na+/H+-dicarboxylate symporter